MTGENNPTMLDYVVVAVIVIVVIVLSPLLAVAVLVRRLHRRLRNGPDQP